MRQLLVGVVLLAVVGPRAAGGDCPAVEVLAGSNIGSGTCVWSKNGRSVVLTCDHLSELYPRAVTVKGGDGVVMSGVAVAGDKGCDVAVVVVDGTLPAAELAPADAKPGDAVTHAGRGSGGGKGTVKDSGYAGTPLLGFASDLPTLPGDSGAGVLDAKGRLVAVHLGRMEPATRNLQRGVPVSAVRDLVKLGIAAAEGKTTAVARVLPAAPVYYTAPVRAWPAPVARPAAIRGGCPGGVCPIPQRR